MRILMDGIHGADPELLLGTARPAGSSLAAVDADIVGAGT
jgi:hypothetical protein